jgi:hypothetical protein
MVNSMFKIGGMRNSLKVYGQKTEGKGPLERPRLDGMRNLKRDI